jgi:hypothetical protein
MIMIMIMMMMMMMMMMLLLLLLLLFLCIHSDVTNDGSLDPTKEEIRDITLAVTVERNGGDRLSALCTIMAFVQNLTGDDESKSINATVQILRMVEGLSDTKPGGLEASVDKFLQDNKEYLECKCFSLQRSIRTDVVLSPQ